MYNFFHFFSHKPQLVTTFSYLFNTTISLFVMVDPFAAVPVYLTITDRFTEDERQRACRRAVFVATGILVAFAVTGISLLNFFNISVSALRIAGGFLLLKLSFDHMGAGGGVQRMDHEEELESQTKDDVSIVPLAMPLLAGPGAISTVIVQSTKEFNFMNFTLLISAVLVVMAVCFAVLKYSQSLYKILGKTGLNLSGRIMGILVAAIAIEFILVGLKETFPKLWQ